VAERGSHNP